MSMPRALGSEDSAEQVGVGGARAQNHRHPIACSCLTPAKRSMARVNGEWLEAAGTVHKTKCALGQISLREARTRPAATNRRGKVRPRPEEEGAAPPR